MSDISRYMHMRPDAVQPGGTKGGTYPRLKRLPEHPDIASGSHTALSKSQESGTVIPKPDAATLRRKMIDYCCEQTVTVDGVKQPIMTREGQQRHDALREELLRRPVHIKRLDALESKINPEKAAKLRARAAAHLVQRTPWHDNMRFSPLSLEAHPEMMVHDLQRTRGRIWELAFPDQPARRGLVTTEERDAARMAAEIERQDLARLLDHEALDRQAEEDRAAELAEEHARVARAQEDRALVAAQERRAAERRRG